MEYNEQFFFQRSLYYERHFTKIIKMFFPILDESVRIKITYKRDDQLLIKTHKNNCEIWKSDQAAGEYSKKMVDNHVFCIYICVDNYDALCKLLNQKTYVISCNQQKKSILGRVFEKLCNNYNIQLQRDLECGTITITPDIDMEMILIDVLVEFINENNILSLNFLNALSAFPYEGEACRGKIVFSESNKKHLLEFMNPIVINSKNLRMVRKYLQICQSGICINVQKNKIVGLIKEEKKSFQIEFLGHMKWRLLYEKTFVMQYEDGRYYIIDPAINQNKLYFENVNSFCKNDQVLKQTINKIVERANKQTHGTMVVFTSDIETEIEYFNKNKRGIPITPVSLISCSDKLVLGISGIDGAIMCDLSGICYMIGTILDGESTYPCNTARGARYNSALTYIDSRSKKNENIRILIAIFSEDGGVDIIYNEGRSIVI